MSTVDLQTNETINSLQNHVAHLTSLLERINTLRKIPGILLAPSTLTGSQLEQGFEQINDVKNAIAEPVTQDCLKLAHESFFKSSDNVGLEGRRQSRKRRLGLHFCLHVPPVHRYYRRPPSPVPDSPRPPPALPKHIFPPSSRYSRLSTSELPSYLRGHNRTDGILKLHIWTPTRPKPREMGSIADLSSQSREIVIRMTIKDVLYAYVKLDVMDRPHSPHMIESDRTEDINRLVVESVTAFGPRERVWYHLILFVTHLNSLLEITPFTI